MAVEFWDTERLVTLLSEALDTIDTLDSSGMTAPRVDDIRKELKDMHTDERYKSNLWYTTDSGVTYILGDAGSPYDTMPGRDRAILTALMSLVVENLTRVGAIKP